MPHNDALSEQSVEDRLAVPLDVKIQEICLARHGAQSDALQMLGDIGHALDVQTPAFTNVLLVGQGCQRCVLRETVRIERRPDAVQVLDDFRSGQAVSDAQSRQTVDLRKSSKDDDVAAGFEQL